MKDVGRIVRTSFWTNPKAVDTFTPEDKYFYLYLLTNPYTTQLGIYQINIKNMAFDLGYNEDSVKVLLERFEKTYKIIVYDYESKEIAIINYLKHSILKGGKPVECCLIKDIEQVKSKKLKEIVYNNLKDKKLNDAVSKVLCLLKQNQNENDNEKHNDNTNHNHIHNHNHNERIDNVSYNESYHESWKCPYGRKEKDIFGECSSCKDMIKCLIGEQEGEDEDE